MNSPQYDNGTQVKDLDQLVDSRWSLTSKADEASFSMLGGAVTQPCENFNHGTAASLQTLGHDDVTECDAKIYTESLKEQTRIRDRLPSFQNNRQLIIVYHFGPSM